MSTVIFFFFMAACGKAPEGGDGPRPARAAAAVVDAHQFGTLLSEG